MLLSNLNLLNDINYFVEDNTIVISNLNVSKKCGRLLNHISFLQSSVHTTTVRLFKDDGQIDRFGFQFLSFM